MQKLSNPEVRRALLRSIISGNGPRAACREVDVSRTSLHRYTGRNDLFAQRMREALAFRDRPDDEVDAFLDDAEKGPTPVKAALHPVKPSPVTVPTPVVIDAEVVDDDPPPARQPGRSKAAFYDRLWDRFDDKNTPLILQVESTRALERHYLREDVLGPQAAAAPRRPRGLSAVAKRKTLHEIIGPRPEASADEDEGVA